MNPEEIPLYPLSPTVAWSLAVLFLPFLSFLFLLLNRKMSSKAGAFIANGCMVAAFLISLVVFFQVWNTAPQRFQAEWFSVWHAHRPLSFTAGILLDNLSVLLLVVVTLVSLLVNIFSISYMEKDAGIIRYYAFLGLFTFSMLGIVLSDNLFLIFMFWELVGLSSYLLIGFWFYKDSAVTASKKAFLVNRIGDLGFIVALMILWSRFETLDLQNLKLFAANLPQEQLLWISHYSFNFLGQAYSCTINWLTVAGLGLFSGVAAKSAQFPLQVWLPDAMEGPTPVSALIHAATMVAAGVFLLARVFGLLNIDVLTVIAFIGAITAFMGAFAAFAQNDIKKVLAYSTISQLGYMVMGMGTGAYDAAVFHLLTHAFFKACLFLCAGSVIYALHKIEHDHSNALSMGFDAQDMRHMGGLRKKLPVTFVAYCVAAAALVGLPLFSGFLSKDALLTGAWAWAEATSGGSISLAYLVPDLAFLTVLMTAAYMTRQLVLVFLGNFRGVKGNVDVEVKESSLALKLPLIVLSILSLGIVFSVNPFSNTSSWVLQGLMQQERLSSQFINNEVFQLHELVVLKGEELHLVIAIVSIVMALAGIIIGLNLYSFRKGLSTLPPSLFGSKNVLYNLSFKNWYLDKIYDRTFVAGTVGLSRWTALFDQKVIDGLVNSTAKMSVILAHLTGFFDRIFVDGLIKLAVFITGRVGLATRGIQGGKIQTYFLWSMVGLIIIFALVLL